MSETLNYTQSLGSESLFRKWWNSRNFIQQRLIRFCLSMLMMAVCFPLYYLGLFGTVDGPLHPARIGSQLAGMGVTRTHSMVLFLSLLIFAVSWNWIFNIVSMRIGSRLTCKRTLDDSGRVCGAPVRREFTLNKRNGAKIPRYVCSSGHKRSDAHFHPLQKGVVSHSIWLVSLAFCLIVLFMS